MMIYRRFLHEAVCRRSYLRIGGDHRLPAIAGQPRSHRVLSSKMSTFAEEKDAIYDQFPIMESVLMRDGSDLDALLEKMRVSGDSYSHTEELSRLVTETSYDSIVSVKKKWMSEEDTGPYDMLVSSDYNARYARQLIMEEEQQSDAVKEYNESLRQLITMGRGTGLKYVQRVLLRWYEPLTRLIDSEMALIEAKKAGHDRMVNFIYIAACFREVNV